MPFAADRRRCVIEPLEDRRLLSTVTLNFDAPAGGVAGTGFSGVLATWGAGDW
jgi:hypothetical protein